MIFRLFIRNWRVSFALVLLALGMAGCATTDADMNNHAERPWNSPKGWENGIPAGLTEGR